MWRGPMRAAAQQISSGPNQPPCRTLCPPLLAALKQPQRSTCPTHHPPCRARSSPTRNPRDAPPPAAATASPCRTRRSPQQSRPCQSAAGGWVGRGGMSEQAGQAAAAWTHAGQPSRRAAAGGPPTGCTDEEAAQLQRQRRRHLSRWHSTRALPASTRPPAPARCPPQRCPPAPACCRARVRAPTHQDRGLHHLLKGGAGGLQDRAQVLHHLRVVGRTWRSGPAGVRMSREQGWQQPAVRAADPPACRRGASCGRSPQPQRQSRSSCSRLPAAPGSRAGMWSGSPPAPSAPPRSRPQSPWYRGPAATEQGGEQ